MHLLIVAATDGEVAPLVERLTRPGPLTPVAPIGRRLRRGHLRAHTVDVLVTGVGMVATAVHLARALADTDYDLALNLGVCGALDRTLPLGAVVHVTSDCLPELGAEDGAAFIPADALGLVPADEPPYEAGRLVNEDPPALAALAALPAVSGITVNTVHGHAPSIAAVVERLHPQVESMEGAAFMYACLTADVAFAQVRAVSNYVERRNRAGWKMAEALRALDDATVTILSEL